jgi:hypothetical protein
MAERKLVDERHFPSRRKGDGEIRREIWIDEETGAVTRYNLTYLNPELFQADNGRVLGYDNHRGVHHRHYLGVSRKVRLGTLQSIEAAFERNFARILRLIHRRRVKRKGKT